MKRIFGLFTLGLVAVLTMVNCGSGGGGGGAPPVTPPSQSLEGTYSLTGFQVFYSDVTTIDENSSIIASWSGTMKIGTSSFSQSFVINNTPISVSGSATISWITPNVSGIAHVTDPSGTHDVGFIIAGNTLSTYSGVVESGTPGLTFEEYDYWTKISDSLSLARGSSVAEKSDEPAYTGKHWIGELLVQ